MTKSSGGLKVKGTFLYTVSIHLPMYLIPRVFL